MSEKHGKLNIPVSAPSMQDFKRGGIIMAILFTREMD